MQQALRPYVTAGVALVGASMIAITPAATPMAGIQQVGRDVALTALGDIDFTSAFDTAFQNAGDNLKSLSTGLEDATKALTDAVHTHSSGLTDLFENPKELLAALSFLGTDEKKFLQPLSLDTLSNNHGLLFDVLLDPSALGTTPLDPDIMDVIQFLSSPASAELIGALGPEISPFIALFNDIDAIQAALSGSTPNITTALQDLVNIPGNMLNGLLNGATLNLDSLVPDLAKADLPLPSGMDITGLSYDFGGLLTPGVVTGDGDNAGIGGSIFNGLGLNLDGVPVLSTLDIHGHGVSMAGGLASIENVLADVIDGKAVFEPPADTGDGGASGAAAAVDPSAAGGFDAVLSSIGIDPAALGL